MCSLPLYEIPHRNPKNKPLQRHELEAILKKWGIAEPPNSLDLYQRAFIHESFILTDKIKDDSPSDQEYSQAQLDEWSSCIPMQRDSYERLECLGDKVLGMTVIDYLYHRYPDQDQGFLTQTMIELVKGENLAKLTGHLKWGQYLMLSRVHESHRYTDTSYLEDVFESFIGALYLDFGGHRGTGFQKAYTMIINIIEHFLNLSNIIYRDENYKDLLLQYYHKTFDGQFPRYKIIANKDKYHRRAFTAGVLNIDDHIIVTASDPKKVKAEQKASRKALKYFGQEVCSSDDDEAEDYFEN